MCHLVRSGVVVLLRLAWVVTELAYRVPRLLAVSLLIRSGSVILYGVALRWRSSVPPRM